MTSTFLTFYEEAAGEAVDKAHPDWIAVRSWSWSVAADTGPRAGTGAAVGRPTPSALVWTHAFDASSLPLLRAIWTGRALARARLEVTRTAADQRPVTWLSAAMERLLITEVATSGAEDGSVQQQVSMVFGSVTFEYAQADPRTGALRPSQSASWNVASGATKA